MEEGRKGKIIYPTEFGMDVIEVLDGRDVISPELTAVWEEKLGKVEDGDLSYQNFYKDMLEYTKEQTESIVNEVNKDLNKDKETLGKCPKCGKDVIKGKNYYLCSGYKETCDFIVGRTYCGVNLKDTDIEKILNGEETRKMNFKFKSGKKGTGRLKYDKDENRVNIVFEKREKKEIGECPKCGAEIVDGKNYYLCSKYKDTCDFIIGKKILGANIGVKDAKDLIAGKETGEKEFTWKSGKKGKASLKLDGEKNIKFVFK